MVQRVFRKSRPKIRSNLTWQVEHVLAEVPVKKAVHKTKQAARGDDRRGANPLFEVLTPVFTDFQIYATQCSKNRKKWVFSLNYTFFGVWSPCA